MSLPDCIRVSISAMPTSVECPSRLRLAVVLKKVHVDGREPVIWKLPPVTAREGALEVPIDPKAIADAFKAKLAAVHTEQSRLPVTEQELFLDAEKTFAELWGVLTSINSAVREKFGTEAAVSYRLGHFDIKQRSIVGEIVASKALRRPYRVTFQIHRGRISIKAFTYHDEERRTERYDYAPGENLEKLVERLVAALVNYFGL
ncbi:MAG: hypothetical protein ACLQME_06595 [Alphaproteobacteria bacterium]